MEAVVVDRTRGLVVCALIDLLFRHVKDEGVVNGKPIINWQYVYQ